VASDPALESAAAWAMAPDPAHFKLMAREPAAAPGGPRRVVSGRTSMVRVDRASGARRGPGAPSPSAWLTTKDAD
jgi:hypothetical protein